MYAAPAGKGLICFIRRLNRRYWERKVCLNIQICKSLVSNLSDIHEHFHPLEVVGRGSETQL